MVRDPEYIANHTYLSPFETRILVLVENALGPSAIADELNVEKTTVDSTLYERIPEKYEQALEDIDRIEATLALLDETGELWKATPWTTDSEQLSDQSLLTSRGAELYLLISEGLESGRRRSTRSVRQLRRILSIR